MSDNKKYYYLKLKEDFFDSSEIKVLEAMPNGYKYSNLLIKLYLKALKFEGALRLNEFIPYNLQMISAIVGMDIDTVKVAFDIFKQLKLIEILDDGTIYMLEIQNFIGKSTTEADRKRKYRAKIEAEKKKKLLEIEGGQMSDKNPPEIEKEIDKEIEIEKDNKESKDILSLYEELGFGFVNQILVSDIDLLVKEYTAVWVKEALKEANEMGVRNLKYVRGILKNWRSKGFKSEKPKKQSYEKSEKIGFNNFEPRSYDYDELEKKLLGWD